MPTEKVLIYRSDCTADASRTDLSNLFKHYGLFSQVDVGNFDVATNLDQLNPVTTTIVIPGGSACSMGKELQEKVPTLKSLFTNGSNGVFICAGAYIACENMRICTPIGVPGTIESAEDLFSIGLTSFTAIGPFLSSQEPIYKENVRRYIPKCTSLNLYTTNSLPFLSKQIYIEGCGLTAPMNGAKKSLFNSSNFDVVADYPTSSYSFIDEDQKLIEFKKLAAIVRKKPLGGYGGFFVSGVHIEAFVQESVLLKAISDGKNSRVVPLANPELYQPEEAENAILPILAETLTRNSP